MTSPLPPAEVSTAPPADPLNPGGPRWPLIALAMAALALALATLYHLSFYLRIPVDIVAFWEGPYLNDIIRIRLGLPIYGDPLDNNGSVYTPGAQLLTYAIAHVLGRDDSIPFLRILQFSYTIGAAILAAGAADQIARRFTPEVYRHRGWWWLLWVALLILVGTESRFNQNNHTLHPDSLTLLISMAGFWLLARYHLRPARWQLAAMAAVPALGFWSKQSLLIWGVIFVVNLALEPAGRWRRVGGYILLSGAALVLSLALLYAAGGPYTTFWIFEVLGGKSVSLPRSLMAVAAGGFYFSLSLAAALLLVFDTRARSAWVFWLSGLFLLLVECYTTGVGFQKNHLGPGVMVATAWFLASLPRLWDLAPRGTRAGLGPLPHLAVAGAVLGLFLGAGLLRPPVNPVSRDFQRYVDAIEAEFQGLDPRRVLMDRGSWPYFKDNILMKDRASSVALHVGQNQAIRRDALTETIRRIEARSYDKILVRDLDAGTTYDTGRRGSGVLEALLANYVEVRRIPAVEGIDTWWPIRLLAPVSVMVPRAAPDTTGDAAP